MRIATLTTLLMIALGLGLKAGAEEFGLLSDDGKPFHYGKDGANGRGINRLPSKVVINADLHGAIDKFLQIQLAVGNISPNGDWTGGDSILVINGDVLDGQPDARPIFDLIIKLQKQARLQGGRVIFNVGNHEVLALLGDDKHMDKNEAALFENEDPEAYGYIRDNGMKKLILDPKLPYGKWLCEQNVVTVIGQLNTSGDWKKGDPKSMVIVHANLRGHDWDGRGSELARINATFRAWARWKVYGDRKPPANTGWVVGLNNEGKLKVDLGPTMDRTFQTDVDPKTGLQIAERHEDSPKRTDAIKLLDDIGAYALVVGHAPNHDGLPHFNPYLGERFINADSHMAFGGQASCVVFDRDSNMISPMTISPILNADKVAALKQKLVSASLNKCEGALLN